MYQSTESLASKLNNRIHLEDLHGPLKETTKVPNSVSSVLKGADKKDASQRFVSSSFHNTHTHTHRERERERERERADRPYNYRRAMGLDCAFLMYLAYALSGLAYERRRTERPQSSALIPEHGLFYTKC